MQTIKINHDKVNLVYTTDWHISSVPPGRREDDYLSSILNKLDFVRELTYKVKGVALCGGDVWHIKDPRHIANSVGTIVKVITSLSAFPLGKVVGSIGNHDLRNDDPLSVPTQPIGILIAAGVYHDLNSDSVLFVNQDESVRVLVETFPYAHGREALDALLRSEKRPEICTHRIAIVHAYGEAGNGGGMFGEALGYNQLKNLDYDFMLGGHDHSYHETIEVGGITHINTGALARAAYESDERERPVVANILSFSHTGVRHKEVEIPVSPLKIAFKTADKRVEAVANSTEIKNFFTAMEEQVGSVESTDTSEVITLLCPPEEPKLLSLIRELCGI